MGCFFSYFQSVNFFSLASQATPRPTEDTPKVYSWYFYLKTKLLSIK